MFVAQTDVENTENIENVGNLENVGNVENVENVKECVTALIVITKDGPIIKVQGIEKNSLTSQQLERVQQQIREELKRGNCDRFSTHKNLDYSPIKYLFYTVSYTARSPLFR